jgi:hypothetical protein
MFSDGSGLIFQHTVTYHGVKLSFINEKKKWGGGGGETN